MSTHDEAVKDIKKAKEALDTLSEKPEIRIPDPAKHFKLSMYNSAVRIVAGGALCAIGAYSDVWLIVAGACIIVAEIIGIAEEMV
jgi:hypothetical protein